MNILNRSLLTVAVAAIGFQSQIAGAASFDCGKARTDHEKMICSTPAFSEADGNMGTAYSSTLKTFPIKGYIRDSQRIWLNSYRSCKDAKSCVDLVNKRITALNELKGSSAYADYKGNDLIVDQGTIIVIDHNPKKKLLFFGVWLPDGRMDPDKMKGYPHDGNICDEEIEVEKKGDVYISKDGPVSDDFSLKISDRQIEMKGRVNCGRGGFDGGVFMKK